MLGCARIFDVTHRLGSRVFVREMRQLASASKQGPSTDVSATYGYRCESQETSTRFGCLYEL